MGRRKRESVSNSKTPKAECESIDRSKYKYVIKVGWFKTGNIKLHEALINDVVLRVNLIDVVRHKDVLKPKKKCLQAKSSCKNGLHKLNNAMKKKLNIISYLNLAPTKRYYLKFPPITYSVHSTLSCSLDDLIGILSGTELPVEFKVVVTMNHHVVKSVRITNNQKPEKCVIFVSGVPYRIIINGVPVTLLGCPRSVKTNKDIQNLVKIVNSISLKDCMVLRI